jgi:hypothetical protein
VTSQSPSQATLTGALFGIPDHPAASRRHPAWS